MLFIELDPRWRSFSTLLCRMHEPAHHVHRRLTPLEIRSSGPSVSVSLLGPALSRLEDKSYTFGAGG